MYQSISKCIHNVFQLTIIQYCSTSCMIPSAKNVYHIVSDACNYLQYISGLSLSVSYIDLIYCYYTFVMLKPVLEKEWHCQQSRSSCSHMYLPVFFIVQLSKTFLWSSSHQKQKYFLSSGCFARLSRPHNGYLYCKKRPKSSRK